jgi:YbbR domain-containing protein
LTGWLASLGRNKGLKLLSFFLAVMLWFAVGGEERTETTLNLQLELVNLNPALMIVSEVPPHIQVQVTGPRSIIRSLSQSRLVHTVDLAGLKAGSHTILLGPSAFSFPRGITVSRVQPNPLNLTLAKTATRTLAVQPLLTGNPPEGYEVKSVKVRPDHVTVKGVESELENLKAISTLPINLSNLSGPVTLATDLDFKNLHITLKDQAPILVDLVIIEKIVQRTLPGVPVYASPQAARLNPAAVTVTLSGPFRRLRDLKPTELLATVDTQNLKPGRYNLRVSVHTPEGLQLQKISPPTVTARVAKPS